VILPKKDGVRTCAGFVGVTDGMLHENPWHAATPTQRANAVIRAARSLTTRRTKRIDQEFHGEVEAANRCPIAVGATLNPFGRRPAVTRPS